MSLQRISLQKLLSILYLPQAKQISELRKDIRSDLKKANGEGGGGGHFHMPFWTDAKSHAAGVSNLSDLTEIRVDENWRRKRLYPILTDGFLNWWGDQRRYWNEPINIIPKAPHGTLLIPELAMTIKAENLLALKYGGQTRRVVYPYFSEYPALPDEGGRIAIWALNEALQDCSLKEIYVLDILRGTSFSVADHPLKGNEKARLMQMSKEAIALWKKLRKEYP